MYGHIDYGNKYISLELMSLNLIPIVLNHDIVNIKYIWCSKHVALMRAVGTSPALKNEELILFFTEFQATRFSKCFEHLVPSVVT